MACDKITISHTSNQSPEPSEKIRQEVSWCHLPAILQKIIMAGVGEFYYDHNDLIEIFQDQEILYRSLQTNVLTEVPDISLSNGSRNGQTDSDWEMNSTSESQLALDVALVRSLQELEDQFSLALIDDEAHAVGTVLEEAGPTLPAVDTASTGASSQSAEQDDLDSDNMTYEELQSLGDSIGTESKGLSDDLISLLQSHKYKTGLFLKKKEKHDCVVCCMSYKNREAIITLTCKHDYHSKCIKEWLKINKACPVCNKKVFGS